MGSAQWIEDKLATTRRAARASALAAATVASFSWLLANEALVPLEQRKGLRGWQRRRFMRRMLKVFAVDVVQEGEAPPADGARVVVCNHRSGLDIPLLASRFDEAFLSRADLGTWPFVGYAARHLGTVFVDRGDHASRTASVKAMRRVLEAQEGVIVFPEGSTFAGDEIRPFAAGAFVAAKSLDVTVLPVGVAYERSAEYVEKSFGAHLHKVAALRSVRCALVIGESRKLGPARAESERLREEVAALTQRARVLVGR